MLFIQENKQAKSELNWNIIFSVITMKAAELHMRHERNYIETVYILTVCAFIFPVIKANKSVSDIEMVQSAFLAARQSKLQICIYIYGET